MVIPALSVYNRSHPFWPDLAGQINPKNQKPSDFKLLVRQVCIQIAANVGWYLTSVKFDNSRGKQGPKEKPRAEAGVT